MSLPLALLGATALGLAKYVSAQQRDDSPLHWFALVMASVIVFVAIVQGCRSDVHQ